MKYREGLIKETEFFTTSELAAKLKMNVQVITRKIQAGELKAYKLGKDWRIPERSVYQWLEERSNHLPKPAEREESGAPQDISTTEQLAASPSKRKHLLEYILAQFESNRSYCEQEVNQIISRYLEDCGTIRQEFVSERMMYRKGGRYRRRTDYRLSD
ncbi:MAG: DUF2087 domain-containing protein [Candidatus Zixiibacteriota bacterium]